MEYIYQRDNLTFTVKEIYFDNKTYFHLRIRPAMTDDEYDAIKYRIESLGGHWRERFGGFIFDENPIDKLNNETTWQPIIQDDYVKWCIARQFYPTPADVALHVIELCEISGTDTVLEPSAGKGALIRPLGRTSGIRAIEIDEGLARDLKNDGYNVLNMAFEDAIDKNMISPVDRVVMNPPFSGQRDIKHIMAAYNLLKENGILVAIMSENDLYYDTPLTQLFNEFLKKTNAYIEAVPMRSFKESGTMVDTIIVKIQK